MDKKDYYTYSYRKEPVTEIREEVKKDNKITKKAFIITLIICFLVTTIVSMSATFLVLTKSNALTKRINTSHYDIVRATGAELSIQEIALKNENSVVAITTESITTDSWFGQFIKSGAGSGVVYSSDGYVLTNNHVISGASKVNVTLHDGTEYSAHVVAADSQTDIAVLKVDATDLSPVTMGDSSKLSVGDLTVAIGNPLGTLSGTVTEGIISALERTVTVEGKQMALIQTSAAINPGNSGGGLFDQYGNLIGIVVAKSSGTAIEGLGFAIPINKAIEVAESLLENGYVTGRPVIGIQILDLTNPKDAWQYGVSYAGVYIQAVTGKNAEKAGLKPGDMIYKIDDTLVTGSDMFIALVQEHNVGDTISLTIVRDLELDKMIKIEVILEESTN